MVSKPKANSIITSRVSDDMVVVSVRVPRSMTFTVLNVGDVATDLTKWSPECLGYAVVHGIGQRIPDAAAIGVTDDEGNVIPKDERTRTKFNKMQAVVAHYETGTTEWSRVATGGGSGPALAVLAFAKAMSITPEAAKERIERRAKDAGRTYAKQLAVVAQTFPEEYAAVKAEREARLTPAFDADAEIAALRGE